MELSLTYNYREQDSRSLLLEQSAISKRFDALSSLEYTPNGYHPVELTARDDKNIKNNNNNDNIKNNNKK